MKASFVRLLITGVTASTIVVVLASLSPTDARSVTLGKEESDRLLKMMSVLGTSEVNLKPYPGITPEAAARIVAHRKAGKAFTTIEEFRTVSGMSEAQFDKLAATFVKHEGPVPPVPPDEAQAPVLKTPDARPGKGSLGDRRNGPGLRSKGGASTVKTADTAPQLDLDVHGGYFSVLPGYDLSKVDTEKRKRFLDAINSETCNCGCSGETLGYCIVNDPGCPVVKSRVKKVYTDIVGSAPVAPAAAGAGH